ncbi:MAG: alpha-glucan family phosphorylase [Bryobacteraceae bacterium]|nr:alpha-glucan family phosphorylase [Bryobacteraceae bacterium]
MRPIGKFKVKPKLPPALEKIRDLAYNLRWTWNADTVEIFRRLDSDLWDQSGHNPVRMLGMIDQDRLHLASNDDALLANLERVAKDLEEYQEARMSWFRRNYGRAGSPLVGYFSAEFGLTESLSIFAGGLGILAGDHLKSASDLGVPLVGVGLLYQQGYFRQQLSAAGWQQEVYETNEFANLPVELERTADGDPLMVRLEFPGRPLFAQVWRALVGRIPLYLLDTNTPVNQDPEDRDITDQLYGGDTEMRLKQEIVLGIGGYRALEALGYHPTVFHMNEGHSAFLALEHIKKIMSQYKLTFWEALELAESSLIFTTHTPVAAGHDYFTAEQMRRYFFEYAQALGVPWTEFLRMGHSKPSHASESFCMTALALRLSAASNGVSRLHGEVSRRMWESLWPGIPADEIPIGHVTNGVHFQSWISADMDQLYDRYLGPKWREEPGDRKLWQKVESIPNEELWRTHERQRERLVAFARKRLLEQLERRGVPAAEIEAAKDVLDSRALTIGFARRFASYKRATLFLKDRERMAQILNNKDCPVQIIFAGKAHPRDEEGKKLIHEITSLIRQKEFRDHMVFIENYDMEVARYLVQGSDVWLNTPLRPNEACGTSGMKAAANGVLNLSTLDGWFAEAWNHPNEKSPFIGWAIGRGEVFPDREYQDQLEAEALYDVLERDVIPSFYERGPNDLPKHWLDRMKSSIGGLCHTYNSHRMAREYTEQFYLMAHSKRALLSADGACRAKTLAVWRERIHSLWPGVRIESVTDDGNGEIEVGSSVSVRAKVHLGDLTPEEVTAELYWGRLDPREEFVSAIPIPMRPTGKENHLCTFEATYGPCEQSGLLGYTVRVMPHHKDLTSPFLPGYVTWAPE